MVGTEPVFRTLLHPLTCTDLVKHLSSKCSEHIGKRSSGVKFALCVLTKRFHFAHSALFIGETCIDIPFFRFDLLLHPWITQRLAGILKELFYLKLSLISSGALPNVCIEISHVSLFRWSVWRHFPLAPVLLGNLVRRHLINGGRKSNRKFIRLLIGISTKYSRQSLLTR